MTKFVPGDIFVVVPEAPATHVPIFFDHSRYYFINKGAVFTVIYTSSSNELLIVSSLGLKRYVTAWFNEDVSSGKLKKVC